MRGFMMGYGHTAPTTFPLDLEAGLPRLKMVPIRLGSSWVEEEMLVETQHLARFTRYTLDFAPSVVAYYSHFADGVNHVNWKAEAHGGNFFIGGLSSFDLEPGPAITMVMRFLDRQLGELMRRLPEDSTLVVVSDHGFDFRGYEHDNAPAGVIIIRGPDVRPGIITGASLIDVTPTLLHLLGIEVAEDMLGRPIEVARPGSALDRDPVFIASHGPPKAPIDADQMATKGTKEHEDYLRALGYVQ